MFNEPLSRKSAYDFSLCGIVLGFWSSRLPVAFVLAYWFSLKYTLRLKIMQHDIITAQQSNDKKIIILYLVPVVKLYYNSYY